MRAVRRETGGYALLYVLLVVLALCAGAMAICTVALRGYQGQARSVEQTRQLYQAEGEIEKFVALASDVSELGEAGPFDTEESAKQKALEAYRLHLQAEAGGLDEYEPADGDGGTDAFAFTAVYGNADVRITAEVSMALEYQTREVTIRPPEGDPYEVYYAQIIAASPTYLAYDISRETEGGDPP